MDGMWTNLVLTMSGNGGILAVSGLRTEILLCAGILEQAMGARNRAGIGLSYQPARLQWLTEPIPWNRFLGSVKVWKYRLWFSIEGGLITKWKEITWARMRRNFLAQCQIEDCSWYDVSHLFNFYNDFVTQFSERSRRIYYSTICAPLRLMRCRWIKSDKELFDFSFICALKYSIKPENYSTRKSL